MASNLSVMACLLRGRYVSIGKPSPDNMDLGYSPWRETINRNVVGCHSLMPVICHGERVQSFHYQGSFVVATRTATTGD